VCKGDLPPQRVKRLPDELQKGPILLFHQGITLYYARECSLKAFSAPLLSIQCTCRTSRTPRPNQTSSSITTTTKPLSTGHYSYQRDASQMFKKPIKPVVCKCVWTASKTGLPNCASLTPFCLSGPLTSSSTTMLSIGIGDSDSAGVSLIPLRASTKPSVEWRRDLQQQRDEKGNRRGHSRVWLIGDAIHAMQPNR
jgi:hypothetical protein